MLEKNYTNPEDRGRFGFSAAGKYNAPYKAEHVYIAVIIAAAIVVSVIFVLFMFRLMRSNVTGMAGATMFEAFLIGVPCVGFVIIFVLVARLCVKFVLEGMKCTYIADEDKFTAMIGGTSHTIYYKDVQSVFFLPRIHRGTVRGYDVTIKLNGMTEEYGVTSTGYISEQATPFYIIKERVDILRAAEERERDKARLERQKADVGTPLFAKPKDEGADTMSRLASILGKDAEMPGVSAAYSNAEKTAPLPDIASRVSPTVNGYADDMPAVGRDGKIISQSKEYIAADGRAFSENDIIARGTFRAPVTVKTAVITAVIAIIIYALIFSRARLIYAWLAIPVGSLVMVIIAPFCAGTIINYLRSGREYTYKANGREFVVTSKKSEERFLYRDVQSVTYKRYEFLWFIRGYKVEILTKFGIARYDYVPPGFGRVPPEKDLPFEVIKKHIGKN